MTEPLKNRVFRLSPETLAELDAIAATLTAQRGIRHTRTDALRHAAREAAKRMRRAKSRGEDDG